MIKNINIHRFILDHCPMEINIDTYNRLTYVNPPLTIGQSTKKQYCSERYQRRFGAWTTKQKCAYISNIFRSRVYTPIILAPVTGHDRDLDDLTMNIKYACLDGQHRSHTIAEFVNNQFGFTGTINGTKYNNTYFNKMSEHIQLHFLMRCEISICIIEERDIDLAQIFIDINDGQPLNDQEKRNAMNTPIAAWSRKQSKDFRSVFNQISKVQIERMDDCFLISRLVAFINGLKNDADLSNDSKALDNLYQSGVENQQFYDQKVFSYISSELLPSLRIVADECRSNHNSKIRTRDLFAFTLLHMKLSDFGKQHSIRAEFLFDYCKQLIATLDSNSANQMLKDEEKYGRDNLKLTNYFYYNTTSIKTSNRAKHFVKDILNSFDDDFNKLIQRVENLQKQQETSVAAK